MSVLSVFDGSARALEIARVVTRYEWSFLSQLLNRGDAAETRLPQPQVLCQILIELGPVYVKLGQLLSTRPDLLAKDYIDALSSLQADVPAEPWEQIEPLMREALGQEVDQAFGHFEREPIAAGSIGQVYRANLHDNTPVAVCLLYTSPSPRDQRGSRMPSSA